MSRGRRRLKADWEVRVAPTLNGKQAANSWKVFTRNRSFYLATRQSAQYGKLSFHPGRQWSFNIGDRRKELLPPAPLSNGWHLAAEIRFVVDEQALAPMEPHSSKVWLVDVSPSEELVFKLLWTPDSSTVGPVPFKVEGDGRVEGHRLDDGSAITVLAGPAPRSADSDAIAKELTNDLVSDGPTFRLEKGGPHYGESHTHAYRAHGNFIVVVPMRPGAFGVGPDPKKQP